MDRREVWEIYASAWKVEAVEDKRALFERALDPKAVYTDPLMQTRSWGELEAYMTQFHQQLPGGHFVTTWFHAHHDRSIARWDMRGADGGKLGEGISYGRYAPDGRLLEMTGFFETPGA